MLRALRVPSAEFILSRVEGLSRGLRGEKASDISPQEAEDAEGSDIVTLKLRALRVLRGEIPFFLPYRSNL